MYKYFFINNAGVFERPYGCSMDCTGCFVHADLETNMKGWRMFLRLAIGLNRNFVQYWVENQWIKCLISERVHTFLKWSLYLNESVWICLKVQAGVVCFGLRVPIQDTYEYDLHHMSAPAHHCNQGQICFIIFLAKLNSIPVTNKYTCDSVCCLVA